MNCMHGLAIQCDGVVCHLHNIVCVRRLHILYISVNAFLIFFALLTFQNELNIA